MHRLVIADMSKKTNRSDRLPNDLWSSIASSSALVSESVIDVDMFPTKTAQNNVNESLLHQATMQKQKIDSPPNLLHLDKGVNRHKYSADSIRRILDTQEIRNGTGENQPSDRKEGDDEMHQHRQQNGLPAIVESAMRWVHVQKIKRQKDALEKAVEEQRRILLQESLRSVRNRDVIQKQEELAALGLQGNETFQNITSKKRHLPTLSFCGGGSCINKEEFTDYYEVETRASSDEYMSTASCRYHGANGEIGQSLEYSDSHSAQDEETFRIGQPCHTVSGQGVAVQLEILEKKETVPIEINIHQEQSSVPFILKPDQMTTIASNGLPCSIAFTKWKRLYCLQRDGDSFTNSFLRKVKGVERTLLVVETTNHEIMVSKLVSKNSNSFEKLPEVYFHLTVV